MYCIRKDGFLLSFGKLSCSVTTASCEVGVLQPHLGRVVDSPVKDLIPSALVGTPCSRMPRQAPSKLLVLCRLGTLCMVSPLSLQSRL